MGVADTANQAFDAATRIVELFKEDRERITMGVTGPARHCVSMIFFSRIPS